jgi:hypothetical protein
MDEYIQADNDFRQRREEAYKYSEMIGASDEIPHQACQKNPQSQHK